MSGVPARWSSATLSEIAKWGSGGTPQARNPRFYGGQIPWAVIGDLNDGLVSRTQAAITAEGLSSSSAKMVPQGAVLVAMYGSIGKLGIAGLPMATNQAIAFAIPDPRILPRFLFYYLMSQRDALNAAGKGATQRNISQTVLKSWPIQFPDSTTEQQKIVEILDDHLSRIDTAVAEIGQADQRRLSLRSAVIISELRRAGGEPTQLAEIARDIRNGIFVSRPKAEPNGVAILRIGAVRPLSLDLTDLRYSERSETDLAREDALLSPGDLLFTRYNGNPRYVGACAVVPQSVPSLTYPDKLIRVRPHRSMAASEFVALACSVGPGRQQIQSRVKTTSGQAGVSGADLKRVVIALPGIEKQLDAVSAIEERLRSIGMLASSLDSAKLRARQLRRSLLGAAFTGRLTRAESTN